MGCETHNVRDHSERVFLYILRLLMFTFPEIDGDDFERNFFLLKNDFDRAGASRQNMFKTIVASS